MAYCGEKTLVGTGDRRQYAITLRCRSWGCEHCREMRRKQLTAFACGGRPNTFITLTSRRVEGMTPQDAAKAIVKAWRQFRRKYLESDKSRRLDFLAIFEATKNGWP